MNIAKIDLNLLQTFDAIYAEASVSRAADRLGVSQPTVSHALARLRTLYGDPLFVRRASGVTPTAKADRLADAVRQALHILDVAIHEADRYDPAASERTFRLHMTDIGEAIFLPRLMAALARRAPRVRVEARQLDDGDILPALESARIDLALGRSHPATARALESLRLASRVRLSIPHFMVLPRILAETDLAVVMPLRLYDAFAQMGDYTVWRSRLGLPAFDVSVHSAWRFAGDAGNRWLRELIVSLFREK